MNIKNIIALFAIALISVSCFKEDEMIPKHQAGDLVLNTVEMGQYYETQAYFDLGTDSNMAFNSKDAWDLAFGCSDTLMLVKLNSAKFSRVAIIPDTNFHSTTDTVGLTWKYDACSGNLDSLALDSWYEINGNDTVFNNFTFVLDRGISALGVVQGVRKFRITGYKNGKYSIMYSNLNNSKKFLVEVQSVTGKNFVQLNLTDGTQTLDLEPVNTDWDLLFTQYTDILTTSEGEKYPYLVTGVLTNPMKVEVAFDDIKPFGEIDLEYAENLNFSKSQSMIGYGWKYYDFDSGIYTVLTENSYIIKDTDGVYFKLRFVGFYNNSGLKGYPQFEFQKL